MKLRVFLMALAMMTVSSISASFAISEGQEIEIGRQSAVKVEAQYGLYNDKAAINKINRIGHSIARISDRPNLPYTFKILNTDKVNALSAPGGFTYVTKGLLQDITDDELAFVLGHEIAHAARRHSVNQLEKTVTTRTGLLVLTAIFNKGKISQGSLNTVKMASTVLSSGYSRKDEKDADITACYYMVNGAGANPRAAGTFLRKLKKKGSELPGFFNDIIGDHPLLDERIQLVDAEAKKMGY